MATYRIFSGMELSKQPWWKVCDEIVGETGPNEESNVNQRILNQHQARAVADAMCALNNVSARISAELDGVIVHEDAAGFVRVSVLNSGRNETYSSQNRFMAAYEVE